MPNAFNALLHRPMQASKLGELGGAFVAGVVTTVAAAIAAEKYAAKKDSNAGDSASAASVAQLTTAPSSAGGAATGRGGKGEAGRCAPFLPPQPCSLPRSDTATVLRLRLREHATNAGGDALRPAAATSAAGTSAAGAGTAREPVSIAAVKGPAVRQPGDAAAAQTAPAAQSAAAALQPELPLEPCAQALADAGRRTTLQPPGSIWFGWPGSWWQGGGSKCSAEAAAAEAADEAAAGSGKPPMLAAVPLELPACAMLTAQHTPPLRPAGGALLGCAGQAVPDAPAAPAPMPRKAQGPKARKSSGGRCSVCLTLAKVMTPLLLLSTLCSGGAAAVQKPWRIADGITYFFKTANFTVVGLS